MKSIKRSVLLKIMTHMESHQGEIPKEYQALTGFLVGRAIIYRQMTVGQHYALAGAHRSYFDQYQRTKTGWFRILRWLIFILSHDFSELRESAAKVEAKAIDLGIIPAKNQRPGDALEWGV